MTVILPSLAVAGGAFPSPDVILTWRATNAREEKSYDLTSPADEREEGDATTERAPSPAGLFNCTGRNSEERGGEARFRGTPLADFVDDRPGWRKHPHKKPAIFPHRKVTSTGKADGSDGCIRTACISSISSRMDDAVGSFKFPAQFCPLLLKTNNSGNNIISVSLRRWNEKVCYVARSRHPRNLR